MSKIRVGIAGAGFVSHIHMAAYEENKNLFEVVGVCALHPENAEKFVKRYGLKKYIKITTSSVKITRWM